LRPLEGKTAIVTGAAGGIGHLLSAALTNAGARVVGVDRVQPPFPDRNFIVGDLGSQNSLDELAERLADEQPAILVNLAGIQYFGPLSQQPTDNLWSGYVVNLIAPAFLARSVIPGMQERGTGQIVNIGSVFGQIPFAHFASYSSAKAGLRALSEALRRELSGSGVSVTHVAPRAVRTPLNSSKVMEFARATKMTMDEPEAVVAKIVKAILARTPQLVIGFPESLFVHLNALAPRLIDRALAGNDRKAAALFR
jgi:short-subunit dehydrogenase